MNPMLRCSACTHSRPSASSNPVFMRCAHPQIVDARGELGWIYNERGYPLGMCGAGAKHFEARPSPQVIPIRRTADEQHTCPAVTP